MAWAVKVKGVPVKLLKRRYSPRRMLRELGHGGDSLVKKVYGHLGEIRHRANAVEYRVQQHLKAQHRDKSLREWVKALRKLRAA